MNIEIRRATLKDLDLVMKLWQEMHKDHFEIVIEGGKDKSQIEMKEDAISKFKDWAISLIKDKNKDIRLIYVNHEIVGYIILTINDNIPVFKLEKIGYISDLFLKKEYRGKGTSTKIKNDAIKWFKSKRLEYIALKVHPENTHAHNIYKKWGFKDFHIEMRKKLD